MIEILTKAQIREQLQGFFSISQYIPSDLDPKARMARIERYANPEHFLEWCKLYLPEAFTQDFAVHHDIEVQCLFLRGQFIVLLLPRGYGKTTVIDAFTLWSICYGYESLISRLEYDKSTASSKCLLFERTFFPTTDDPQDFRIVDDYQIWKGRKWSPSAGELYFQNTHNPYAKHHLIVLRCGGARSIQQGQNFNWGRVGVVFLNDVIKNSQEARSSAWNKFIFDLVKNDLMYAGGSFLDDPISIVFVTTIQAPNDISHRFASDESAVVYKHNAIEGKEQDVKDFVTFVSDDIPNITRERLNIQGYPPNLTGETFDARHMEAYCLRSSAYQEWFKKLKSTWPAKFPMYSFVWEIFNSGSEIFLRLRQHIVGDSDFIRIPAQWFQPYTELPSSASGKPIYAMCIDWSGQPKEGNDPRAIYCGAYQDENLYTLGVWCNQNTDKETFEQVYTMFWECFPWYSGTGVTIWMEDIIAATGISVSYFEAERRKRIAEIQVFWQEKIITATEEDSPQITQKAEEEIEKAEHYWRRLPIRLFRAKDRGDKLTAIMAIRPFIEQRRMFYIPDHSHQNLMVKQAGNFEGKLTHSEPNIERKVDILDTIAMFAHIYGILPNNTTREGPPVVLQSPANLPPKPGYVLQNRTHHDKHPILFNKKM